MAWRVAGPAQAGDNRTVIVRSSAMDAISGIVHGFTTRTGSDGRPLDLSQSPDWGRVGRELGLGGAGVAHLRQVHGARVVGVDRPGPAGAADAMVTGVPGLLLVVRVADCVPILVAGRREVAAIHAGWRGLAAGVIRAALARVDAPLVAAVGPRICVEHYEVGDEVVAGIAAEGVPPAVFVRPGKRPHVDLGAAAAWQLRAAGVKRVDLLPHCTWEDPRFWSFRRQRGRAGRQAGVIGLRP